jgi:hypothetical protein
MLGKGLDDFVVALEGGTHDIGVFLPQAGAVLEVGEEESDGAGGEVRR